VKKTIVALIVGLALGAGVTWLLSRHGAEEAPPAEKHKSETHVEHGTNDEHLVKLDRARQVSAGIVTANPQAMGLSPEVKGYGRVLDPTPLAALLLDIESAEAALEASAREYKRARVLFAQNQNASVRALESAKAAMKRDRAMLDAARARLLTGWGKPLAEREDLPAMVKALTALESALVRIDLPPNELLFSPPTGARLISLSDENRSAEADFLSPAPTTDAQMQGKGFLFLLRTNSLELRPDTAVTGFLKIRGELLQGVVVSRSAVVRHEQRAWVYIQTDNATFARKPIVLQHPSDKDWFITEGLSPSDRMMVSGAQVLLSEELKPQIRLAE
jgi:hypothetical protein